MAADFINITFFYHILSAMTQYMLSKIHKNTDNNE